MQNPKDITIPNDPWGMALWDYWNGKTDAVLYTQTSHSEVETLPVSYLFRSFGQMPMLEQYVMQKVHGRILDLGCGAGAHLKVLTEKGFDVLGVDSNAMAVHICQQRGFKAQCTSDWTDIEGVFDHVMLLMNGTGLLTPIGSFYAKLQQLMRLLRPGGSLWIDTTDIRYLWPGSIAQYRLAFGPKYYGYVQYSLQYKGLIQHLPWLYLDADTAAKAFEAAGVQAVLEARDGVSTLWRIQH